MQQYSSIPPIPYPSEECGTDGTVTDISLPCLNKLLSTAGCTTTFSVNPSDSNTFTLVGSTPGLLRFSSYGQTLLEVDNAIKIASEYPVLCQAGTYTDPNPNSTAGADVINRNNIELNGLGAQYGLLYKQYTHLLAYPPARINTLAATASANLVAYNTKQALATAAATGSAAKTTLTNEANDYNTSTLAPAVAAAAAAASAYTSNLTSIKNDIDNIYGQINSKALAIKNALTQISPQENTNRAAVQANAATLVAKIGEMQAAFNALNNDTSGNSIITELDGNYEVADVKTKSKFMKNMFYILFAIFVVVCLVMINLSPTEGKLDKFIMALGVIILVYYIYDYFAKI